MSKLFKIYCSLFFIVILIGGCASASKYEKITTEMDQVISKFIIEHNKDSYLETEKQFEVHKIYGSEEKNGVIEIYMYSFYEGFNRATKEEPQSGSSAPVLVQLKKDGGKYVVANYKEPEDGDRYADSIKAMFPKRYAKTAIHDTGNVHDLQALMDKKVKEWL